MLSRIIIPTWPYLRQAAWCLLLVLYSLAAVRVESVHAVFHAQEVAELHSPEHESNPCHKSIYHQEQQTGCAHPSHFTENKKCPLCEYHATGDQLLNPTDASEKISVAASHRALSVATVVNVAWVFHTPRGPPAIA
jgi:hypothetical protein